MTIQPTSNYNEMKSFPVVRPNSIISFENTKLIREYEGHSLTAYKCPAGKWTISYGITGPDIVEGLTITQDESNAMFAKKLAYYAWDVLEPLVKVELNHYQFLALLSFVWNVGGMNFKHSTLLKKLNKKQYSDVPSELMRWIYITKNGKKVKSRGLVKRRLSESRMFMTGDLVFEFSDEVIDSYMN
jgi:lysozyme